MNSHSRCDINERDLSVLALAEATVRDTDGTSMRISASMICSASITTKVLNFRPVPVLFKKEMSVSGKAAFDCFLTHAISSTEA